MIIHRSEELLFECQDNTLFKELITHKELFSGSGDVSVSVLNSHTSESCLLDLDGNTFLDIKSNLSFSCSMDSWVGGSCKDVETFVS